MGIGIGINIGTDIGTNVALRFNYDSIVAPLG
jgi:hypothetical protein